jgi:hypothetical protein
MTKYTFNLKNNSNNTSNTCPFFNKCNKSTDYSKILDDLINADIKEKNPWLYTTSSSYAPGNTIKINYNINDNDDIITTACKTLEYNDALNKAFKFFANYNIGTCPFKTNTLYKIGDDIKFMILIDGILINDKMFFFDDFNDYSFLNLLTKKEKKTIATIYTNGLKITIKK